MKKTEDIIRLIGAGAHIELTGNKSVADLVALAAAAAKSKTDLRITGSKKVEDLLKVVQAGRGRVTIRF
jgi:antitoxin (DNA-binding transcriptional repressor) of toxin-antitoxin stability system